MSVLNLGLGVHDTSKICSIRSYFIDTAALDERLSSIVAFDKAEAGIQSDSAYIGQINVITVCYFMIPHQEGKFFLRFERAYMGIRYCKTSST